MANRISTTSAYTRVYGDLTRTFNRMSRTQGQIASSKKLERPSDNPTDVAVALKERSTQRRLEQYANNATDAVGWLRVSDSALMGVQEQAMQARVELASAVSGATDTQSRDAIANAIEGIRDNIVQLGNTSFGGRFVFGGTASTATPPFAPGGGYVGDNGNVRRVIDEGVTVDVNMTGAAVFGTRNAGTPLAGDMFQILDEMAKAVRANDTPAIQAAEAAFQTAVDRVSTAQIHVGGVSNQVEGSMARSEMTLIDVKARLSRVEDTDIAEALISLSSDEAAYRAALGVTARVIQPTLMDFLR
jgi:flagellar hook-associated protein 3 FlgL